MNQPNQQSVKSSSTIIPHLAMEQANISSIMSHSPKIEQMSSDILKIILEGQDGNSLLSNLAARIGNSFTAEACIIVSATTAMSNQISYWQSSPDSWLIESKVLDELSHLKLNPSDSASSILQKVEILLKKVLPSTKIWLSTTTQYQNRVNGLTLLLKSHSSKWTNSDRELLTLISDSMSIAIFQTQLQQQVHRKSKHQSLLQNLSREISYGSHPELLFENCLSQICNTLQLDRGMILMLKYQNPLQAKSRRYNKSVKGSVEVVCQWETKTNSISSEGKQFFSFNHSDLCQQAWQNAPQYSCFESGTVFPDFDSPNTSLSFQPQGEALLIMPLMGKKSSEKSNAAVLGFLVLQHDSSYHWSQDELDLVDWVAVQISTAVVNHQTLSQVQSIVEDRTAQLQWSLDVQAKLSEKMRQHIKQLQKLNQLKDDFMNSMSHELKTPLTSMKMAIMMLRRSEISPQMRDKYLDILEQEWNREYGLIKDLLTLQELESGELEYSPEELDLNQTINNLAQSFQEKWQHDKGINLETEISDSNLKINTDAESLTNILNELLLNAGKYSAEDTTIKLTVENQTTLKGKKIAIAIANCGAGITPEELPHVFDKFRRGAGVTDRAVPGTGLGLTLVQNLVEHLNGKIHVTSEPIEPNSDLFITNFVLELPQFQPAIS